MKLKRLITITISLTIACSCLTGCESSEYKAAKELFVAGKYEESFNAFKALGAYKDADQKEDESAYYWSKQLLDDGKWEDSAKIAKAIVTDDTALTGKINMLLVKCDLAKAEDLYNNGKYQAAIEICQRIAKEQTDSGVIVSADNLKRKCVEALDSGNAAEILKKAESEYRNKKWEDVISLCNQIIEIAPGTENATSAEELLKNAKSEIEKEVTNLLSDVETAYKEEDWKTVIEISSSIIESYSELSENTEAAEKYLNDAKQKIQVLIAEELPVALEKLNKEYDDVEDTTWYMPSSEPRYINDYCVSYLYIGQRDNRSPWLRWRTILVDNEWLYFDELIINVDGTVYSIKCKYNDVVRDSNNKNHWEYVDFQPKAADLEIIRAIINSEKTVIRFSNEDDDKIFDFTVSQKEKDGFKDVLEAFELMKYQE